MIVLQDCCVLEDVVQVSAKNTCMSVDGKIFVFVAVVEVAFLGRCQGL